MDLLVRLTHVISLTVPRYPGRDNGNPLQYGRTVKNVYKRYAMKLKKYLLRLLIGIALIVVHYSVIFIPFAEIFMIYILFFNPKWFKDILDD
ncbi:MAG: hypothetical protein ACXW0T_13890 [Methylobacter sp.]